MIGYDTIDAPVRRNTGPLWAALIVVGGAILGKEIVAGGSMMRVLIAMVMMLVLAIPAIEQPRRALLGLFILLPFMGLIRHLFGSGGAQSLDPLLLITSAVAITIFATMAINKEIDFSGTALSKLVFFLMVVGLIQVINPGQTLTGSLGTTLLVGLTGVMINLIPISFFFIARSIADLEFSHKVYRILLTIGTLAAVYGLIQVFFGFRGFEQTWLARQTSYNAAKVGGTVRPFSFFNNSAEYAAYIHYAFVMAFSALLFREKGKRFWLIATVGVIGYGGFLTGSRGFTVKIGLAFILVLAARFRRHRALQGALVILLVGMAVWYSATHSDTTTIQAQQEGSGQLIEQQVRALKDPFNPTKSTLPVHFAQAKSGITYAITRKPFGLGTGVTTRAGAKFSGGLQAGTELDIGDAFLALGILGGILYILIIIVAVTQASRVRQALPGPVWIGIWAMAATSVGAWLTGGNYAVTPVMWFMLGAIDVQYRTLRDRGLLRASIFPMTVRPPAQAY
ncbi:MAG: hypothetical protein ABR552_07020 [Actinomycetota bacterium]|nr:hypothetical protein [Actinomycetota bacterium]